MSEPVRQTGIVTGVSGAKAKVVFKRNDACGHCNACFRMGSDEAEVEISNSLKAKAGDVVEIVMHGKSVLKASLIMYGIPVVFLIAGVAIGSMWSDLYAIVGGLLFAAGAFFIIRGLEPRFAKMAEFAPRMVRILDNTEMKKEAIDDAEHQD